MKDLDTIPSLIFGESHSADGGLTSRVFMDLIRQKVTFSVKRVIVAGIHCRLKVNFLSSKCPSLVLRLDPDPSRWQMHFVTCRHGSCIIT